ncbi:uncharacterized protein LOC144113459 [Amblyomma americanum]
MASSDVGSDSHGILVQVTGVFQEPAVVGGYLFLHSWTFGKMQAHCCSPHSPVHGRASGIAGAELHRYGMCMGNKKKDVQEKGAPRPLWKFCHTKLPTPACLLPNNDQESTAALICSSAPNSALAFHRKPKQPGQLNSSLPVQGISKRKTRCHSCPPPLLVLLKEEAKDLESKTPEGVLEYICDVYGPETVRKKIERSTVCTSMAQI